MQLKAPLYAQLELTYGCNLACSHCLNDPRYDSSSGKTEFVQIKRERVEIERVQRVAERLADWEIFSATLTGGEPLTVKRRAFAALEVLRSRGISVDMNSNLALMTPDLAREFAERGLTAVLTSIASHDAAMHDAKMGKIGSLERTSRGIQAAKGAGLYISSNMVVAKDNFDQVHETGRYVAELGADAFCISPLTPSRSGRTVQLPLVLNEQQMLSALEQLADVEEEFGLRTRLLQPLPHCFLNPYPRLRKYMSGGCDAGDGYISLDPFGNVKPCAQIPDVHGNILEHDLNEIWARMQDYHTGKLVPKECTGCDAISACSGGCRAESERRVGSMASPHPFMKGPLRAEIGAYRSLDLVGRHLHVVPGLRSRKETDTVHIVKGTASNYVAVDETTLLLIGEIDGRGGLTITSDLSEEPEFCAAAQHLIENNVLQFVNNAPVRSTSGLALLEAIRNAQNRNFSVRPTLLCECYEIDPGCYTQPTQRYAESNIHRKSGI